MFFRIRIRISKKTTFFLFGQKMATLCNFYANFVKKGYFLHKGPLIIKKQKSGDITPAKISLGFREAIKKFKNSTKCFLIYLKGSVPEIA